MKERDRKVTGVVLAGGRSSRIGQDKATIKLGNLTLMERVVSILSQLVEEVVVVGGDSAGSASLGLRAVDDIFPGGGVLGGLYTGLRVAKHSRILAVGCDMPFLNPELLRYMLQEVKGYDVVIPRIGEYVEALHAIYSKACLPPIGRKLEEGNLRLVSFFPEVRVRHIEAEEIERFDPKHLSFFNINTPADLRRAEVFLGAMAQDGL